MLDSCECFCCTTADGALSAAAETSFDFAIIDKNLVDTSKKATIASLVRKHRTLQHLIPEGLRDEEIMPRYLGTGRLDTLSEYELEKIIHTSRVSVMVHDGQDVARKLLEEYPDIVVILYGTFMTPERRHKADSMSRLYPERFYQTPCPDGIIFTILEHNKT